MTIKGIIFDKDGTLFDFNATWGAWAQRIITAECLGDQPRILALSEALGFDTEHHQFHPGSVVIAETASVVADHILPHIADQDKAALLARMHAAAAEVPQVEVTPLRPFLTNLRAAGFVLGVATNDAEAPALAHLSRAGVVRCFDFIAGSDSGYGGKPAAGQLMAFLEATGLCPDDCAMVGDSTHDLVAGRAAGMTTIGVLTGPALRHELAPAADAVLQSIKDLPEWLGLDGFVT